MKLTRSLKLLSVLMFCILFINMASAFEFDNVKSVENSWGYSETYKDISVNNCDLWLGTCLNVGEKLWFGSVKSNSDTCGENCKSVVDIELSKDGSLIDEIKFKTLNRGEWIDREIPNYKIYVQTGVKTVDVTNYECHEDGFYKNGSAIEVCGEVINQEEEKVWTEYTIGEKLSAGNYTIKLTGEKGYSETVDWIPLVQGEWIEEWILWTGKKEIWNGIVGYYTFNNTLVDISGYGNNMAGGTGVYKTGIIGTAMNFSGSDPAYDTSTNFPTGDAEASVSVWFWTDNGNAGDKGLYGYGNYAGEDSSISVRYNAGTFELYDGGTGTTLKSGASTSTWHNIVVVFDPDLDLFIGYFDGENLANHSVGTLTRNDDLRAGTDDGGNTVYGRIDELAVWNRTLTHDEAIAIWNNNQSSFGDDVTVGSGDNPPTITQGVPANNTNFSTNTVTINCTGEDDWMMQNVSLYLDGVRNYTVTDGVDNITILDVTYNFADGSYYWYCDAFDNSTITQNATSPMRNFTVDGTAPTGLTANNLTNIVTTTLPINSTWSINATDDHLSSCYYNTTDHALTIIPCNLINYTQWNSGGNKSIRFCANDTFGNEACDSDTIYIYSISYDQYDNPDPNAEGEDAVFNLTVNMSAIPSTTAYLVLNNTVYSATPTQAGSDAYYFETTVNIPDGWGNTTGRVIDWFWNYTISGVITDQSTATTNITVYSLGIDNCSTYGELILNMSLKDEETNALVNASAGSNVEIDLLLTSKENSSIYLAYHNTWTNNNNPQVCIPSNLLNYTDYWIDFTIGFDSTDRVWEFYYLDDGTLNLTKQFDDQTNSTIDLMDLLTADSTSFLFNYFDQDGLPVDDAIVHVFRKYIGDGKFREVERSKADQNGDTIVHVVEEDVIYYFLITQYGIPLYTSSTYTALCQTTPCQIQIEASGGFATFSTDYDLIDGGAISITPNSSTREVALTYALTESAKMNLTVYRYNSDGSFSALSSGNQTGTSGTITLTVPLSAGNVSFFAGVEKDDQFIKSEWVDFEDNATDKFGLTLSLLISALIILTLGLVAVTEGAGTIIMVLLGIFLSGALGLMTTRLSTGVNILVYLILAGGLILWKITSGRRG